MTELENTSPLVSGRVLRLLAHKKKAILSTIPKLPSVTASAFSISNIKKGFVLNGQLDVERKLIPDFNNLLHTFCGDLTGTCLEDKKLLLDQFNSDDNKVALKKFHMHQTELERKSQEKHRKNIPNRQGLIKQFTK